MRGIDVSSWPALMSTVIGIALVTLLGVGVRLLLMITIQQRRERMNRQINERLRTLIAAYKVLGGSFSGDLTVDPRHLRELRRAPTHAEAASDIATEHDRADDDPRMGSDRARRIRDAVEAALSDVILLGTEEQVVLAAAAAHELHAGRIVHTHELVVSLRQFIREALDLAPIPARIALPVQGPTRVASSGARGKGDGDRAGGRQSGGGGGGGGGAALGGGRGLGVGLGMTGRRSADDADQMESPPTH